MLNNNFSDLLYYTNGSHKGFVKFCVTEVLVEITMDEGIRSGKSLILGMTKAPQVNIQGKPRA